MGKKESAIATKSRKRKISASPDKSQSEELNKIQVQSDSNKAEQQPGEKESLKIVIRQSDLGSNLKSMEVLGKDLVNTLSPRSKVEENQTITEYKIQSLGNPLKLKLTTGMKTD